MNIIFPIIELIDRYAIAKLKLAKTNANQAEYDFYHAQMTQFDLQSVQTEFDDLYSIHSKIWELEGLLKTGREQELSLEEIGRRAIEIRDWNNKRIAIKNTVASKLGSNVFEIKKDHLSE